MVSALTLPACAASPAERAAQQGDRALLLQAVAGRQKAGAITNREAANLARIVAEHDVRTASGPGAVERIRDARACAHELDDALADRMQVHDAAGAQAALARIEGGAWNADRARAFGSDPETAWRAVATRSWVHPEDRENRLRGLVDAEPMVRRAAVRACVAASDPADRGALLEAARLDPEPIVRTDAVRALAGPSGGDSRTTVDDLRDLWVGADEALRQDIAVAWASPGLWGAGGREALRVLLASRHDAVAVEAALAVLRRRPPAGHANDPDPEMTEAALSALLAALDDAPRSVRLQAIARAPLDRPEVRAAVARAAADSELPVRIGGLGRLAEAGEARAVAELERLARPGSWLAASARFALATAGDRRVQAWVEEDLGAAQPGRRLAAAAALAALGVEGRAAPLLADAEAEVRIGAACTILMAARRR